MRNILILLLLGCAVGTDAQSLTGIWRGKRTQNAGGCFPEYSLELHITYMHDNTFMGNAFSFDKERYTKVNFKGRYNPLTKRMVIIENAVLQFNVPENCVPCIKTYDLTWSGSGIDEALLGEWTGHEMGNTQNCQPGKITLSRESKSIFPVDIYQNDTLLALQKKLHFQSREKELIQQVIDIDTSQVHIDLYDNAEIDDDTVTVFINNTLLLYKKRLTNKALTLDVDVFPGMEYELMMYADNLGRIPPNTSRMIITAGRKRHELRLSSSEQKSAVVRFRYTPK
jgi:hypothetical protein